MRSEGLLTSDHEVLSTQSLRAYFTQEAKGVLLSCSTGAATESGLNMVQAMANATGIVFAGPDKDANLIKIDFNRGHHLWQNEAYNVTRNPANNINNGGIDLNSESLRLSETGGTIDFSNDNAQAVARQIDGFIPVVFSITPMTDPQAFFGAAAR